MNPCVFINLVTGQMVNKIYWDENHAIKEHLSLPKGQYGLFTMTGRICIHDYVADIFKDNLPWQSTCRLCQHILKIDNQQISKHGEKHECLPKSD